MKNALPSLSTIRTGVTLNVIGSIIATIASFAIMVGLIITLLSIGIYESWSDLDFDPENLENLGAVLAVSSFSVWVLVGLVVLGISLIISVVGMSFYYTGLRGFAHYLDRAGAVATRQIAIATLIVMLSIATIIVLACVMALTIPTMGAAAAVIIALFGFILVGAFITALVFYILGYSQLKHSESFDELAKRGANKLFWGFIMVIISGVISAFPVIGGIASLVLTILYWIYMIQGWGMIHRSFAQRADNQELAQ